MVTRGRIWSREAGHSLTASGRTWSREAGHRHTAPGRTWSREAEHGHARQDIVTSVRIWSHGVTQHMGT